MGVSDYRHPYIADHTTSEFLQWRRATPSLCGDSPRNASTRSFYFLCLKLVFRPPAHCAQVLRVPSSPLSQMFWDRSTTNGLIAVCPTSSRLAVRFFHSFNFFLVHRRSKRRSRIAWCVDGWQHYTCDPHTGRQSSRNPVLQESSQVSPLRSFSYTECTHGNATAAGRKKSGRIYQEELEMRCGLPVDTFYSLPPKSRRLSSPSDS